MTDGLFRFDATWSVDGLFPKPKTLSPESAELLDRLLFQAIESSPRLDVLEHQLMVRTTKALLDAAHEILRTKFPMPCEGVDEPINTIDQIALYPEAIHFSLNATFAAYLMTVASCGGVLRKAMESAVPPKALQLDETDKEVVVNSLQRQHHFKTIQWNDHAIYAVRNGHQVLPREAFGLARLEAVLAKLGASSAP